LPRHENHWEIRHSRVGVRLAHYRSIGSRRKIRDAFIGGMVQPAAYVASGSMKRVTRELQSPVLAAAVSRRFALKSLFASGAAEEERFFPILESMFRSA